MSRLDPRLAAMHKEIYSRFLDELDSDIVKEIMNNPSGEEASLLNRRVEAEIRRKLELVQG